MDSTIRIWSTKSGNQISTLDDHTSWVNCCYYSLNGGFIISASDDHTLKLWDTKNK